MCASRGAELVPRPHSLVDSRTCVSGVRRLSAQNRSGLSAPWDVEGVGFCSFRSVCGRTKSRQVVCMLGLRACEQRAVASRLNVRVYVFRGWCAWGCLPCSSIDGPMMSETCGGQIDVIGPLCEQTSTASVVCRVSLQTNNLHTYACMLRNVSTALCVCALPFRELYGTPTMRV